MRARTLTAGIVTLLVLSGLSSCASTERAPASRPDRLAFANAKTKESGKVWITAAVLNDEECKAVFGEPAARKTSHLFDEVASSAVSESFHRGQLTEPSRDGCSRASGSGARPVTGICTRARTGTTIRSSTRSGRCSRTSPS